MLSAALPSEIKTWRIAYVATAAKEIKVFDNSTEGGPAVSKHAWKKCGYAVIVAVQTKSPTTSWKKIPSCSCGTTRQR